jgi:hypothetical protein
MYLAKNVGGWSTTRIGRFYNGRHHTTVLYAIEKIERLRQTDESLDALIEVITAELSPGTEGRFTKRFQPEWTTRLIDAVADRVLKKIPAFDPATGAVPRSDHRATLEEIGSRFGFPPRRRWLLKGLRAAVAAFWTAGIEDIVIDGSFCTEKPDPGDVDGYWVEPDDGLYDRINPSWIDFEMVLIPQVRKWKWRMWPDHGVAFFRPSLYVGKPDGRVSRVFPTGSWRSAWRHNSNRQVRIMIKSDAQRERTAAQIEGFGQALPKWTRS